ncbi:MAG: hypothetical protein KC549_12155, partial [Myxococcales bacterium]|nr:hypothetical protein [Myxococcales bacterium]
PDAARPPVERVTLAHAFGPRELEPFQEETRCVQWTLDNDAALYVERVALANGGGFHHSNWFVVPEDEFPGEDGYFRCRQRGFDELRAALAGAVLFAQSTQSQFEEQRLGDGVVIKVPPRHKVVANVHLLNLSAGPTTTSLQMALDVVHPRDVRVVVTPFRYSYLPLTLPALQASRFTADCHTADAYRRTTGQPFDMKLYWLLPHYHELGNWFDVTIRGGARDGESIYRLDGFDAEPHGKAFDPPLDISDIDGLAVTCGYDNPRPVEVGWGTGDQEMCVMLGFAEARIMLDNSVVANSSLQREELGISYFSGPCVVLAVPKAEGQAPPTPEELAGPLVVPAADDPGEVGQEPECVDTPADALALTEPTLENLHGVVFRPSCAFSACHGATRPAAGLDLSSPDAATLEASLRGHQVDGGPLVVPGDPEASPLYQRVARCVPTDAAREELAHMPLNSPTLLPPDRVALVRDWILSLEASP